MKTKFTLLFLLIFTYVHLNAQKRIVVDPDLTLTYYTYLSANNLLFQDKFKDNKNKIIKMGKVHEYKLKKWKIDVNKKNSQIGAFIEFIGSENNLRSIGIKVRSQVGNFFTIDLPLNRYEDLLNLEGLVAIEMGKPMEKTLDNSIQSIKADLVHQNLGYKGEGVIIGVLDNGFDLKHPAFMKSDRSGTRIKYCWDQSLNGSSPSGFNYGTEYDELEINSSSFFEPEFHGTLVAGIAAGNGFNENGITPYVGIAPEADLVLVDIKQRVGDDNLPFSDHIIDGLIYISGKAKALNKPWVANISLLAPYGPRDGTSIFEKTVNEISNDNNFGEGRIIVVAAGNKGYTPNLSPESNKTHARDNSLTSTKNIIVNSINDTYISNHEGFSLYMYTPTFSTGVGSLRWEVTIVSPNNNSYGPFNLGGGNLPFFSDTPDGFLSVSDGNPFGSELVNETLLITFGDFDSDSDGKTDSHLTNGNWQLIVNDANQRGGAWDAYLHREGNNPNFYFADDSYDNTRLIGEPGNASNVITVGSYNSKNSWLSDNGQIIDKSFNYPLNEISHFSSPGPTRANFIKPEIYAPGAWITGPVSRYGFDLITENVPFGENLYYTQVGTSFAAPHVTGVVALLLEKWNVQRGQDYGWNYMKELLYEGATPEKYLDAWASLSIDEAPLGIEDKVKIDNNICSGGNKIVIDPGVLNKYCASFYYTNPLGDYMMNYDWSLELFNSDGIFVANTANTGQGPSSTVYLMVNEADLNKKWERDENGNIKGRVRVSGVDNDGIYHEDKISIGLKYKPNKPVIYGHILGSSSITLSFLAGGSENYKVHYSTSPGPPYTGIGANEGNSPLSTSNSEYTISGLDFENNTYYFAVTATNTNGESEYSDPIVIGDDQTFEVFDIVWTDLVKVYANGNTLTRDNSYRGWNAGAASVNILQENLDGWIELTVQETDEYVMFGLSHSNPGASWNTIKFNVYLHVGTIKVYELGTFKGSFSSYNIGDKIRIERSGSSINYMKNGEIFYSSSTDPNQILLADVCMYTPESTIYNAKASFEAQIIEYDIEWTDLVKVYANGNSLTRDDSYRGWIAGAASSNILSPYQDGWIESTIQETNTYRMFGLSSKNMDASWNTIEYNMYLRNDAKIDIYESGSWKCSNCGTYSTGDKVRLERDGSTINYILNENIIYSSVCDPSQPLLVDVSMYSPGSTIYNTKANFSSSGLNQSMLASYNVLSDNYDLDPISIDSLLIPAGADNNFEESDIINVSQKTYLYDANTADSLNTLSNIKINPNPTKGALNLKYLSPNEKDIHISIIDVDNFIVYFEKDWIIKKGENKMKIDISLLKPDLYIVRFLEGENTYSIRIKKE